MMNIAVYTPVPSLADRWFGVLADRSSVFQAESIAELDSLLEGIQFDLLVLHDRELSLEKVAQMRQELPASKIFILSDRPDEETGLAFLRLGVVGFGNSYMTHDRLTAAVEVIASGSVWINQSLMRRLIVASSAVEAVNGKEEQRSVDTDTASPLAILSKREFQIAHLVARGFSNVEIGRQLGITERTVKAHMSAIFSKLGIRGRLNLALLVNQKQQKG